MNGLSLNLLRSSLKQKLRKTSNKKFLLQSQTVKKKWYMMTKNIMYHFLVCRLYFTRCIRSSFLRNDVALGNAPNSHCSRGFYILLKSFIRHIFLFLHAAVFYYQPVVEGFIRTHQRRQERFIRTASRTNQSRQSRRNLQMTACIRRLHHVFRHAGTIKSDEIPSSNILHTKTA